MKPRYVFTLGQNWEGQWYVLYKPHGFHSWTTSIEQDDKYNGIRKK